MLCFKKTPALLAGVCLFASPAFSQAPVEGREAADTTAGLSANAGTILYTELESMRNEVATLRGLVEELTYKIDQLEQQRQRDYLDVDRRLQQLTTGNLATPIAVDGQMPAAEVSAAAGVAGAATSAPLATSPIVTNTGIPAADPAVPAVSSAVIPTGTGVSGGAATTSTPALTTSGSEPAETLYQIAFGELKAGNTDLAITGFDKVVADWPNSTWAGDSLYWLGETWAVKGDAAKSSSAYATLIQRMPAHARVPDAAFKLGKLHHQWGNADSAVRYLRIAADAGVAISASARQFLSDNYPNN